MNCRNSFPESHGQAGYKANSKNKKFRDSLNVLKVSFESGISILHFRVLAKTTKRAEYAM